jgi:hypothetical protein
MIGTNKTTDDLKKLDKDISRVLLVAVVIIITVPAIYCLWFWLKVKLPISIQPGDWGTFGDYVGGLLNPVMGLFALYWLTKSVRLTTIGHIDMLLTLFRIIPLKIWISLILGIPTSYYGIQWMFFKTAKQYVNCDSDLNLGIKQSANHDAYQYADNFDEQLKGYISCLQHVDNNIGTAKFIHEEFKRL